MNLSQKKCVPCESGDRNLLLDEESAEVLRTELDASWHITPNNTLRRVFVFRNFSHALAFVNQVGKVAEAEDHHPDISVNYNKVTLELVTHALDGLTENDFVLAAKIDKLP